MKDIEQLLANNKAWAEDVEKDMPGFFRKLENQHKPKFLWIGCSDSRVPADQLVGVMPGEVFVHRNISNQVINTDINLMCVLQYAIDFLRVKHIIVCGHYNCGGIEAVLENQTSGLLDHWLENVKDLMERNGTPGLDEMCELNVRLQVRNLALNTIVRRAWSQGHPLFLHGWIYSVSNGLLRDLGVSRNGLENQTEKRP
ncbi:MAG: carbonic anhydrase [Propionivibrio sp.]|nr:carbonic anhydrase [Propionivibrio sp.]